MSKKPRRKKQKTQAAEMPVEPSKAEAPKATWLAAFVFVSIMVLFFASGFSSLIYQVVWTRMLVLVFGSTTFATSTVLAIFMGGLALGSFVAARFSDKVKQPLLWYGVLEAMIGIWALFTPGMFAAATPVYKAVWQATHASLVQLSLLRFFCTALILIVPTTCMGATLPLLARFVATSLESIGSRVGALYSVNTLGAVAGAVATGFFILPAIGLNATLWTAAAINTFLIVAVLLFTKTSVGRNATAAIAPSAVSNSVAQPTEKKPLSGTVKLATAVFAVSGAVAMIYEVCWTRTLLMVIGSSTYAFTVMLASFLIGIFLGSLICSRLIDRAKEPMFWFAVCQLLLGVMTLFSMRVFNRLPYLNLVVTPLTSHDPTATMCVRFMLAGSVLAPITIYLGAIFPAVVKACTTDLANVGRSVGFLYSANTLGAIVGAFLAGFVCLPLFGAERTLIYGAVINSLLGLILIWSSRKFDQRTQITCTVCSITVMAVMLSSSSVWDRYVMLSAQSTKRGVAFFGTKIDSYEEWRDRLHERTDVRFWADGTCSNVGVIYHKHDGVLSLATNGHIDASDNQDMPVQALLSGFPLLLKPDAKDVAVVGWGCGQTVGIATLFPVRTIDAIELEPAVIEASKLFHHINLKPEEDPRVHINYNDGRNFLLATDKKYDVIVSEPSNPWQAGVCNLFTKEYFQICKSRLNDHGMVAIWVQVSEVPPNNLCSILAALNSQFKHAVVFYPRPGNLVVVASEDPVDVDFDKVQQTLRSDRRLKKEFAHVGIDDAPAMVAHMAVSSEGMKSLVAGFVNTDDHNRLEFDVGKSYEDVMFDKEDSRLLAALAGDLWQNIDWKGLSRSQQAAALAKIAERSVEYAPKQTSLAWAQQSLKVERNPLAYRVIAGLMADRGRWTEVEQNIAEALKLAPDDPQLLMLRGNALVSLNRREEARKDLERSLSLRHGDQTTLFVLAGSFTPDVMGMPGSDSPADAPLRAKAKHVLDILGRLPDNDKFCQERPNICIVTAQAYLKLAKFADAERYAKRYLEFAPRGDTKVGHSLLKLIESYKTTRT